MNDFSAQFWNSPSRFWKEKNDTTHTFGNEGKKTADVESQENIFFWNSIYDKPVVLTKNTIAVDIKFIYDRICRAPSDTRFTLNLLLASFSSVFH